MTTSVQHGAPLPLYYQLEQVLRERIARNELPQDTPIPGEIDLAEEFGVSRGTIRKALERLVGAGLIVRERGRGSFLVPPSFEYPIGRTYSFAHAMTQAGIEESSRVLRRKLMRAPDDVAQALGLGKTDRAFRIDRLRLAGGSPLLLESSYVPRHVSPSLSDADLTRGSIYDVMKHDGVHVTRVDERVSPSALEQKEAALLEANIGSLAFEIRRLTYAGDRAVELRSIIAPADRVSFETRWSVEEQPS